MTERALTFGSVAADYERFRPGYPDEVVDEVLAYAGRPVQTALEIGAGTGKATRVFARHGVRVTATDPDAAMLAELTKHVPGSAPRPQGLTAAGWRTWSKTGCRRCTSGRAGSSRFAG